MSGDVFSPAVASLRRKSFGSERDVEPEVVLAECECSRKGCAWDDGDARLAWHGERTFLVKLPHCRTPWPGSGRTWSQEMAEALSKATGLKLRNYGRVCYALERAGIGVERHDILDRFEFVVVVAPRDENHWGVLPPRGLGLLRRCRRCRWCGRIHSATWRLECSEKQREHEDAERKRELAEFMAEREREWAIAEEVREINKVRRITKTIRRLSDVMHKQMSLEEAARILPWRVSIRALLRMCITGKLPAERVNRKWHVTGSSILRLVQQWIDSGRSPARSRTPVRKAVS